jgi:hypothetical protein
MNPFLSFAVQFTWLLGKLPIPVPALYCFHLSSALDVKELPGL